MTARRRTVPVYETYLNEDRACVLVKEGAKAYTGPIRSPKELVDFFRDGFHMGDLAEEQLMMVCFDCRMAPVGVFLLSKGGTSESICPVRETFKKALLCNATRIAVAHNHPSGDITPSSDDIAATERLRKAGKLMGIELTDHVIIGDSAYYSFGEEDFALCKS